MISELSYAEVINSDAKALTVCHWAVAVDETLIASDDAWHEIGVMLGLLAEILKGFIICYSVSFNL